MKQTNGIKKGTLMDKSNIKVKLLSSGKYTWEIQVIVEGGNNHYKDAVLIAKGIDNELRDKFIDVVQKSNSRAVELE